MISLSQCSNPPDHDQKSPALGPARSYPGHHREPRTSDIGLEFELRATTKPGSESPPRLGTSNVTPAAVGHCPKRGSVGDSHTTFATLILNRSRLASSQGMQMQDPRFGFPPFIQWRRIPGSKGRTAQSFLRSLFLLASGGALHNFTYFAYYSSTIGWIPSVDPPRSVFR